MSIYSVLRHRALVHRSVKTFVDGQAHFSWTTVGTDVPVLLDALKRDAGDTAEDEKADRKGLLLAGPRSDIRPGDRVEIFRGPQGTFVVAGDPDERPRLNGPGHVEFAVVEAR